MELTGLDTYVQNWGEQAGIWIILAVTRMIAEILEDYSAAAFGCVPPRTFAVVTSETNQQEIGHRFMTAYQEIYDVVLRTQRKPSSPVWHRRAVTNTFPELSLEVIPTGALASDTPDDAGAE
ncbi:MAG: hypothetical protein GYB66_08115 [Chloroflexi bacterium]|nr:hypothetical protein [Chloroflexota bacterium]